ncbi:hypothetical protein [Alteribacter aurantiacus]|nr:hypothetical protein [Alteribacter aurantiacus]
MRPFDEYPKSIKKAIRYIKQDGPLDRLDELEKLLLLTIEKRKESNSS